LQENVIRRGLSALGEHEFPTLKEIPVFLDINSRHTCFLKQEYKNGNAAIRGKIELNVPKNIQMSQVERVDVLCDSDVSGDIEKNIAAFCITSKET